MPVSKNPVTLLFIKIFIENLPCAKHGVYDGKDIVCASEELIV